MTLFTDHLTIEDLPTTNTKVTDPANSGFAFYNCTKAPLEAEEEAPGAKTCALRIPTASFKALKTQKRKTDLVLTLSVDGQQRRKKKPKSKDVYMQFSTIAERLQWETALNRHLMPLA